MQRVLYCHFRLGSNLFNSRNWKRFIRLNFQLTWRWNSTFRQFQTERSKIQNTRILIVWILHINKNLYHLIRSILHYNVQWILKILIFSEHQSWRFHSILSWAHANIQQLSNSKQIDRTFIILGREFWQPKLLSRLRATSSLQFEI